MDAPSRRGSRPEDALLSMEQIRPAVPYSDALFAVLDATSSAIIAVTASGIINYANQPAVTAFGYARDELIGQPVEMLMPTANADRHARLREGYVEDAQPRAMGSGIELAARRRDGSTFPVEISLTPLPTPDGPWVLAGIVDISPRRAAEQRIAALSRAHLALAELNATILRAQTPEDLFADACRIITAASEQVGTWVAVTGPSSELGVIASDGDIGPIGDDEASPLEAMPALAQVLADSAPWFCRDVASETTVGWAAWAQDHGVCAVVGLPLRRATRPIAVLVIQARDLALLDEEFISVLVTMADNISFALDRFDSQALLRRIDAQRVDLLNRLVAAQEEERSRIAADVHDHSIQSLAAIDLRLGLLRQRVAAAAPALTDSVDVLQVAVSEVTGGLRHLLFELEVAEPQATLVDQLHDALEHVFLDETVATTLRVDHGHGTDDENVDLPPETRAHAIRICKEALTNVRHHARASQVVIVVRPEGGGVEVAVIDDGVGPTGDVETLRSARGHRGLDGMRDRAEVVGGWCLARAG